jgi:hypothetical protein
MISTMDPVANMNALSNQFRRSVRHQIDLNQRRSPTERVLALCDLLDFVSEAAPKDPEAQERRRQVLRSRQREREQWRAEYRRLAARQRIDASSGD